MGDGILGIQISGGADDAAAAAVVAVIAEVLHREAVARAIPPARPRPSAWVNASRPRESPPALPSQSYESVQWHDPAVRNG